MKKSIGTYFTQYFKMPHLFRDELREIEALIQKTLKPKHFRLACEGIEYESVEDIPAHLHHVNVLVLYSHDPCVRIKFARSWAELYSDADNAETEEVIRHIAQLISGTERKWLWAFCKYSAWLAPLIGFGSLAIFIGLIGLGTLNINALYIAVWLLLMVSVWWAIGHRYNLSNFSRIDLQSSRPHVKFHSRQRFDILLFLAGTAFGVSTTWLLGKFLGLF